MIKVTLFLVLAFTFVGVFSWAEEQEKAGDGVLRVWRLKRADDRSASAPDCRDEDWETIEVGQEFRSKGFAWLRAKVSIPKTVSGNSVAGKPLGLRWYCAGGEVYVDGKLHCRYDNDHRAMILLSERAKPGTSRQIAVRVYMASNPEEEAEAKIEECELVLLDPQRARETLELTVDCSQIVGTLPRPFAGLSQGAGMHDYEQETAAAFKDIGIKWVRMDNILTNALKKEDKGEFIYDWSDLDQRTDFILSIGAQPIYCFSYMPQVLDATPCPHRHSRPNDWDAWEQLCYQAVKHCVDRGTPIKYWEVWNETNAGWITVLPGEDLFVTYLEMYDRCARAVKRADPNAWIGGPCNAAGPWDDGDKIGLPGVRGETFLRGLIEHCSKTGVPLDFITWHEYFHPWWIMAKEVDRTREILAEYPDVLKQVKELMVTEWNFAWWQDPPQDHELGAAYCAAGAVRAWSEKKVDKPCFFFAKDGSPPFHGNWGMLAGNNTPKPVGNVSKMFNMMAPMQLRIDGFEKDISGNSDAVDTDLCGLASADPATGRVTVLLVNFPNRYGIPRKLKVEFKNLSSKLKEGFCCRWLVDKEHSNVFNDLGRGQLETVEEASIGKRKTYQTKFTLECNGVTLIELQ